MGQIDVRSLESKAVGSRKFSLGLQMRITPATGKQPNPEPDSGLEAGGVAATRKMVLLR